MRSGVILQLFHMSQADLSTLHSDKKENWAMTLRGKVKLWGSVVIVKCVTRESIVRVKAVDE